LPTDPQFKMEMYILGTGSFGRLEATASSDLDQMIIAFPRGAEPLGGRQSQIDEMRAFFRRNDDQLQTLLDGAR